MADISNAAVSGPVGVALAICGFLAQQYFKNRTENRVDEKAKRESESGIVDTTKITLQTVREQMLEIADDAKRDRDSARRRQNEMQGRIDYLTEQVEGLLDDNRRLRIQLGLPPFSGESSRPRVSRNPGVGGGGTPITEVQERFRDSFEGSGGERPQGRHRDRNED